jgi:hypothetical protein
LGKQEKHTEIILKFSFGHSQRLRFAAGAAALGSRPCSRTWPMEAAAKMRMLAQFQSQILK